MHPDLPVSPAAQVIFLQILIVAFGIHGSSSELGSSLHHICVFPQNALFFRGVCILFLIGRENPVKYKGLAVSNQYKTQRQEDHKHGVQGYEQAETCHAHIHEKQGKGPFQVPKSKAPRIFDGVERRIYKSAHQREGVVENNQPYDRKRDQQPCNAG